jgi:hypothetical protein
MAISTTSLDAVAFIGCSLTAAGVVEEATVFVLSQATKVAELTAIAATIFKILFCILFFC